MRAQLHQMFSVWRRLAGFFHWPYDFFSPPSTSSFVFSSDEFMLSTHHQMRTFLGNKFGKTKGMVLGVVLNTVLVLLIPGCSGSNDVTEEELYTYVLTGTWEIKFEVDLNPVTGNAPPVKAGDAPRFVFTGGNLSVYNPRNGLTLTGTHSFLTTGLGWADSNRRGFYFSVSDGAGVGSDVTISTEADLVLEFDNVDKFFAEYPPGEVGGPPDGIVAHGETWP